MKTLRYILLAVVASAGAPAFGKLNVFACEPEWAALAREIGGDQVDTFSATTPAQDPHFIEARPSLMARVRRADLVVCTGANLEIGWLPILLRQSGNAKINVGTAGFLEASQSVEMLEVPAVADRAAGDIHPYGNPHLQMDPRNIARVAEALATRMEQLDRDNAGLYRTRYTDFAARWTAAIDRWEHEAAPLKGMEVVVHHAAWVYMERWLGLVELGEMEPKPGLPPTAAHLAELLELIKSNHVKAFIRATYQSPRAADWLAERTGLPDIVIPHTVGATEGAKDLFGMFDDMIHQLLEANR